MSMIEITGLADYTPALEQIAEEVTKVGGDFETVIQEMMVVFLARHIPSFAAQLAEPPIELPDAPGLFSVRIPFFCAKPQRSDLPADLEVITPEF